MNQMNSTDKTLEVYGAVPADGVEVNSCGMIKDWKRILADPEKFNSLIDNKYYYCRMCEGYIEGTPNGVSINTLGPLCGRQGTSYKCLKCGYELAFNGKIS